MKLATGASANFAGVPDIAHIKRLEALGFHSVWTAETWGFEAISQLAYIAAHTSKIKLATGIAQIDGRSPALLAMQAETVDALSGGRMMLGIGTSGPQVVEGWHGRPWGKPNYRLRDYVSIMRKVWSGERVSHDGKTVQLPYTGDGSIGLGKPLKSAVGKVREIPILIGAETDLNVRMTGEVSDGLITLHAVPRQVPGFQALLSEGLARRSDGRTLKDFEIVGHVSAQVNDDVQGAIDKAKGPIAFYAGAMGARDVNFHKDAFARRGYQKEADRIQELYLAGRRDEAIAAVPDDYVDEELLIGPLARIKERFKPWRESGFTILQVAANAPEALEMMAKEAGVAPA
jgi:F420-dependent oxidoreductase-like protein